MLTKITGNTGNVSFISGHNACFQMFELSVFQRLQDTTCFGDTFESFTAGLKGGRFSASGIMQYDNTSTAPGLDDMGQGGAITLTAATGCTWAFNGVLSDVTVRSVMGGDASVTFNGSCDGAVTETWDETSGS